MRPLVLDFQEDKNTVDISDQFMFGDSIMVAPILTSEDTRSVYLPAGRWYEMHTGCWHEGGRWLDTKAELSQIPLYIKNGSVIPMCMPGRNVKNTDFSTITLKIFGDCDNVHYSYFDDGVGEVEVDVNDKTISYKEQDTLCFVQKHII